MFKKKGSSSCVLTPEALLVILRPGRETDQPQAEEGSLVDIPSDIVSVHVGHSNGEHVLVGVIVVIVII